MNISIKNVLTSNNELQKIAIKNLEKSKAFTNNILKNEVELFNIWSLIANQYKELNEKKLEEIISIGKNLKRFNYIILESLIKIVEAKVRNLRQKEEISYIEKNLHIYLNYNWFVKSKNKNIDFLWIINGIDNSRRTLEDMNKVKNSKGYKLRVTDELGNRIIKKLQKDSLKLDIKMYDELILDPGINTIINFWEQNKIYFGKRISKKLISLPLVQKIIIHRILENDFENEALIKEIIKRIDNKYRFYDIKVKNFIDKYAKRYNLNNNLENYSESHFTNNIISTKAFWVKEKPFYLIDLNKLKCEDIEEILTKATEQKEYYEGINCFSLVGQNNELSYSFQNSNCSNTKKKKIFSNLIKNQKLSKHYCKAINDIMIFGLSEKIITFNDVKTFLEINIKGKVLIEVDNYFLDILERLIESFEINTDIIFKLLMTIDLSKNDELNVRNKENNVDITMFNNSKVGKYFNIVSLCQLEIKNNRSRVKEKIEETDSIKNYLFGRFISLYEIDKLPRDKKDTFIGFSHRYTLPKNPSYINFFESSAKQIFEENNYDDFIENNLTLILLEKINPIKDINTYKVVAEKANTIFQKMLDIYFYDQAYTQFNKWLEWFVENLELTATLINSLIENIHTREFKKLNSLLEMFKKLKISKKNKFSQISYVRNLEKLDNEGMDFYYKVLLTLKNNDVLIFDNDSIFQTEYLLEQIKNADQKELINNFVNLIKEEFPKVELDKYI